MHWLDFGLCDFVGRFGPLVHLKVVKREKKHFFIEGVTADACVNNRQGSILGIC